MTPQERAEKMVQTVLVGIEGSYFDYFLSQISEAERESYNYGLQANQIARELFQSQMAFEQGYTLAKEQAAKIAMDFKYGDQNSGYEIAEIAKQIRAMTPEGHKCEREPIHSMEEIINLGDAIVKDMEEGEK